MISFTAYDIESRPHSREVLDALLPEFKPHPACKTDEAKTRSVAEKVAEFYEKAALSPLYGSVVVIGLMRDNGDLFFLEGEEREILEKFWALYGAFDQQDKFCFWSGSGNSKAFDADFLVTRSRILGVKVPPTLRRGRYYHERMVDLAAEFLLHANDAYLSLSNAARVLGLFAQDSSLLRKGKNDEVRGENFWQWYDGLLIGDPAEQREKALGYLANDLRLTTAIAKRIL